MLFHVCRPIILTVKKFFLEFHWLFQKFKEIITNVVFFRKFCFKNLVPLKKAVSFRNNKYLEKSPFCQFFISFPFQTSPLNPEKKWKRCSSWSKVFIKTNCLFYFKTFFKSFSQTIVLFAHMLMSKIKIFKVCSELYWNGWNSVPLSSVSNAHLQILKRHPFHKDLLSFGSKYSRVDQVKFVEDNH